MRIRWFRSLSILALGVAAVMLLFAGVALGLSEPFAASAAVLCALVFFVPGLFFLNEARRLRLREVALAHAAAFAKGRGIVDATTLGKELRVPAAVAEKILQKAIREGHIRGAVDARGVFIAVDAPRCPSCHAPIPREPMPAACPTCGAPLVPGA